MTFILVQPGEAPDPAIHLFLQKVRDLLAPRDVAECSLPPWAIRIFQGKVLFQAIEHIDGVLVRLAHHFIRSGVEGRFSLQAVGHRRGEISHFPRFLKSGQVLVRPTVRLRRLPRGVPRNGGNRDPYQFTDDNPVFRQQSGNACLRKQRFQRLMMLSFMKRELSRRTEPARQPFSLHQMWKTHLESL